MRHATEDAKPGTVGYNFFCAGDNLHLLCALLCALLLCAEVSGGTSKAKEGAVGGWRKEKNQKCKTSSFHNSTCKAPFSMILAPLKCSRRDLSF